MSIDPELLKEFLVESFESLDSLDQEMVALESSPGDKDILNGIFRRVHTIKGTCGFLELKKLESITHVGENLLDSLRAGRLSITQDIASVLLNLLDAMRTILQCVEATGEEGEKDYSPLAERLGSFLGGRPAEKPVETAAPAEAPAVPETMAAPVEDACNHDLLASLANDPNFSEAFAKMEAAPPAQEPSKESQPAKAPERPAAKPQAEAAPEAGAQASGVAESSLRVDVGLLDQLMNLVGELVLARNQVLQFTKTQTDPSYLKTSQRLNLITSELQERVMRTRMQPISNVWSKFPRVVRDVAKLCGKEVRLDMEGKETELDKTILEAIKDPLTHIIRNAVDHGVEAPEVRAKTGKEREGKILLKAFHEGGHVIIEIIDDGGGLNTEKIKKKAIEKGVVSAERANEMSKAELQRLIFAAGFSTADQITNISGRGVGMDVVRSNIEKIGGKVEVSSELGQGTMLRIKIPLTLAIVPALMVSSGGQRFAVPQVALVELVRLTGERIFSAVEEIHGACFHRLRGELMPLVHLNNELKLKNPLANADKDLEDQVLNVVVVKAESKTFGIVVDEVHDTEEIVVKPLGKQLKGVSVFAGATIMGDGKVALIVDVPGLARKARVVSAQEAKAMAAEGDKSKTSAKPAEKLLIVQIGDEARGAIPLSLVNRLEEFEPEIIEQASGAKVVQYRGGILPLIDLPGYFGREAQAVQAGDKHKVVVYQSEDQTYGLLVESIVDIVEEHVNMQFKSGKRGVLGSAVIHKKVTDLVDVQTILADSRPE